MNILLVCPMQDAQSGTYIHDSLVQLGHRIAYFDWRYVTKEMGVQGMNQHLIKAIQQLSPDLTIIIKGLGITGATIEKIKTFHNKPIVGWIFDVTLGGILVKDVPPYIDFTKTLDKFYTIDADAVTELRRVGVNAEWLSEGCFEPSYKELVFNSVQAKKYGADIVFLGALGSIHPNREKLIKRICDEGFNFKIYGEVGYPPNQEPEWVKNHHTGYAAINDYHSLVVGASKIIIGIDGWPHRSKSWSARLYRTLCAGGFYLVNDTKDIGAAFKPGKHLDTFKDENDLIEKIIYWLGEDEKRETVGKAGQDLVLKKHQFKNRLQKIIKDSGAVSMDEFLIK